jgi:hypothetical protein
MNTQKVNKQGISTKVSVLFNQQVQLETNPENSTHLQHLHEKPGSQIYNNDAYLGH